METLKKLFRRIFAPEFIIKEKDRLGELPGMKSTYSNYAAVAWPAILEAVLIALMGFVDTVMVSSLGSEAISAVGVCTQPRLLFFALFFSLTSSVIALVSRRCGEGDRKRANESLAQALTICFIMAVVIIGATFFISKPLLYFAGAKDDIIDNADIYNKITMVGMCINSLGMVINAAQRVCGNTRIAMKTTVTANAVNMVFNYLLINGIWFFPRLGVTGAAVATLIGNVASAAISFSSVMKKHGYLRLSLRDCVRFKKADMIPLWHVASGAGIEQIFIRFGFFVFAKIIAHLGTDIFATHQICMNIINISFSFGDGLGVAASALVGQNLGKRRGDLSLLYGKIAQRIGILTSSILFIILMTLGTPIVSLFTDKPQMIADGTVILRIIALVTPAQISQVIFTGCLRGAGDTRFTAVMSLFAIGIFRPVLAYIFCYTCGFGLIGAWSALLIDQYIRFLASSVRFAHGKWMRIKL